MDRPAPATSMLLHVAGLSVSAGGSAILSDVHLELSRGDIVVLIGPNGSGKTTLLRAILGLVPYSGTAERRANLTIGYVPQNFARDPSLPLTVRRLVGLGRGRDDSDIEKALERLEIAGLADKQVTSLSGGELKRVLLARAVAGKPDLLLLDEPVAGVDLAGEAALYHLIAQLRDETGCGVLLVSHDLHVVMAQATHVVCLNRHVCCEGTAGEVIRDPEFVRLFGAHIANEIALYHHHHDHTHDPSGGVIEGHG